MKVTIEVSEDTIEFMKAMDVTFSSVKDTIDRIWRDKSAFTKDSLNLNVADTIMKLVRDQTVNNNEVPNENNI